MADDFWWAVSNDDLLAESHDHPRLMIVQNQHVEECHVFFNHSGVA